MPANWADADRSKCAEATELAIKRGQGLFLAEMQGVFCGTVAD